MSGERWYEFEQRDTVSRPVYVKATSLKDARARVHQEGIPDYPPSFPDMWIGGRGRIARDQSHVDALAAEDPRL